MRLIWSIAVLCLLSAEADQIRMKSLACPEVEVYDKIPPEALKDDLQLSLFAVANDCRVLSPGDAVKAIGHDPRNEKSLFVQIIVKKSGERLYMRRSKLLVEQPGKKNQVRF